MPGSAHQKRTFTQTQLQTVPVSRVVATSNGHAPVDIKSMEGIVHKRWHNAQVDDVNTRLITPDTKFLYADRSTDSHAPQLWRDHPRDVRAFHTLDPRPRPIRESDLRDSDPEGRSCEILGG